MKFKIFSFKSIVTYLTMVSFYIATTLSAFAAPLPPISLAQMYSLASQGNVRALRAAVQRGMNIDATDRYGNTGLCHSIYQNNYTAYNAFHASGANPRHPCIQNIPPQQYDYFMASSRATPVTATPRDAYKEFADGEFVFSTTTWVIGGLLLAGGIAAIALSGGGGGKKHHYYFPPNDSFTPTDDSLGAFVGTETPSAPENSPYTPVKITNGENDSNFTLSNDSQIKVGDETKNLVDVINLNDSVLDYTKYIQVGMKAIDGNQVVNGKIPLTGTEVGATITLQNNTAGMVALHNSNAINNNTLKIIARNGTLGMIASDKSLVRNNGNIDIAFQGTTATDQVDGMYADTSSTAINDGKITGNAAVDSVAGTLIGMQGRLINQVQNPAGTIPTQLINNGNISLSAAATPDKTISTSLVGMGSFLEKAFLEGTKLLRRTGFIEITNAANGVIDLNVNLGDSGTYDSTQSNLLNGTGGIVGIRSDAHTTATNNGTIRLTIAPESTKNITNSHAGMLSVHGGTIVNNKEITVTGGIGGYGMLGVRGEGTNSEFNTLNPTIVNSESGTISVNSTDGFGMATRHGGTVVNKGTIKMLAKGTGLQINAGTGTNSGTITLSNGGDGMTIRQNVTTEAGTANNASSAKIQNTETGVIDIKYANGSNGMFIEDGTAENNGSIKINGTDSTTTEASYGIHAQNGTMLNTGSIDMDVILSGDADSYGMYGENSASATNAATGKITFTRKGTGMYTTQGTNTNHGQIVMNGIGSTGMASESGAVLNGKTGSIQLVSGTGIKSTSGSVTNQGSINISQGEDSVGISSGSNAVNDKDATIQITGANSTGISVEENATAVNRGTITLTSTQNSKENYGMISAGGERAQIDNDGIINLNGYDYAASKEVGYGMSIGDGRANNNNTININRMYGYGMASTEGTLTNNGTINLTNGGYGIMGESGESFNNKDATITITGTPNMQNSYGMSMQDGTAKNFGQIDVTGGSVDSKTYGISVNGGNGLNHGLINMHSDNAFGLFDEGDGEITNVAGGTINLYGNNSVGMQTTSGKAENFGTINIGVDNGTGAIVGGSGSTGMIAGDRATAINSGHINMNGNNAVGMTANGGIVTNGSSGKINAGSGASYLMLAENGGTANNKGTLTFSGSGSALQAKGATVNNTGSITATGSGNGMAADGTSSAGANAVNSGTITVNSGKGMIATSTTIDTTVTNASGGVITVNSNGGVGMYADGSHARAINLGTINIKGTSSTSYGMKAVNGGSVENAGTINMAAGSAGTGIYVDGKSTFYNNASGKIVFAGGQTQSGTITGDTSAGSVDICDDGGSCANKFIHLEQGATLQNSGTMITSASFKLNEMGGGRVLLASTGTMVAGNEISGDLYAVSDRAMLEQGQKDVYVNRNALTASEIDVNLMSASPMWEVSLVDSAEDSADDAAAQAEDEPAVEQPTVKDEDEADNDSSTSDKPSSEKDIVYNRVAFSNLVNNASQAAYLESNYAIRNTIYDGMITAGSMEEFNQALYSNLGLDLIPNFAKQNMDILRNVNRQVNSAVFNNNDTKEFRVHVGYDYFEREQDGTNGLSGYEDEAHTGYALFDKKYNANFRYGLGASFTKYSSDYDNGAERDEVIAQIMAPLIFETDSTKVVSMPRIGMGWGEYTRYDHTGEYKADTRNYYYGITNEARHELDMGLLTLEPVAEFNIIGLYQGRTKENIRVDSGNNLSVEGGLGLYAKKSFKPMGDDELNIRLGGTYYHEFNNPYQAVSAGIVGLQGRYHMNSYETQRNRAVLSSRFDYKRGKFNFYLEGSRFIEDDSTYSVNAGLTYAF